MQSVQGIAAVAGPGLGGLLVGLLGQSWPLYFDAISFGLGALGTWMLVTDRRPDPGVERPKKGDRDLGAGMRILFRDGVLRPLVITFVVFLLALVMINVAEVFFITKTLHSSALVYGLVGTSFGIGNILGAVGASKIKQHDVALARASLWCCIVIAVATGLIGLAEHVGYLYPILLVLGIAVGVVNVTLTTLMTVRTPEAQRGRMFAASSAVFTSAEILGTVFGGLILTVVAPRSVFQIAGVVTTAVSLLFGPLALRATRSAKNSELETQGA
jgi:predicted MFS family arabinose efflux permease